MTFEELTSKVMSRLEVEAGSNEFWEDTEILQSAKDLYRETTRELRCLKSRDATIDSVVGTARYVLNKAVGVGTILEVLSVSYDGVPVDYATVAELNNNVYKWRSLGNGTPIAWYFEYGDENIAISFVQPPGEVDVEIAVEFIYIPDEPDDDDEISEPFKDGLILLDGVMSVALAKAGGGRDLDRSDWYFGNFAAKASAFNRHKVNKTHVLGSIDDGQQIKTFRLGSNYPTYTFD